ncbi:MAG TPA: hypothetical protein VLC71_09615 [Thermomonas sp.]|nr:hypothetical protein [Thermomonas sp.]
MQLKGTVQLGEHLVSALGRPICSLTAEFEYLVYEAFAIRSIEALMHGSKDVSGCRMVEINAKQGYGKAPAAQQLDHAPHWSD